MCSTLTLSCHCICIFVMFLVHPLFTSSVPLSMCCIIIDKLFDISHSFLSLFVHFNTLHVFQHAAQSIYKLTIHIYMSLVSRTEEYYFPLRNQSTLLRDSRCGLTQLHYVLCSSNLLILYIIFSVLVVLVLTSCINY